MEKARPRRAMGTTRLRCCRTVPYKHGSWRKEQGLHALCGAGIQDEEGEEKKGTNRCLGKAIAMLVPMSTWLHCLQQTRSLAIATCQCSAEKPALAAVGGVAGRAGGLAMGRSGIPDGGDFNKPNIRRKGMTADSISEASPETSTALL